VTEESSVQRNSIWLFLARLTAQGLAILFIAILARHLDLEAFGQFTYIAAILLIGNTVTNFGTDTYIIREIARARQVTDLLARALGLQLFLSASWIIITLFNRNIPLIVYSFALLPLAVISVATASLRAFERMDLFWALNLATGFVQILCAIFSLDIKTLVIALLIGNLILAALAYWICSVSLPDFNLFPLKDFTSLFKLTLPFAALTILLVLSQRLGVLTVSALLGNASTGIFSSVTRIVDGLKIGHYAILGALLPVISRGTQESKQSFRKGFVLLMTFSFMVSISLVIFPRLIILGLFGEKFIPAIPLLSILGWSLIPYTISSFISYDLIARGHETTLAKATLISGAVFLLLYLLLIPLYNLNGSIYAALTGEILQAIIFVAFLRPYYNKSS